MKTQGKGGTHSTAATKRRPVATRSKVASSTSVLKPSRPRAPAATAKSPSARRVTRLLEFVTDSGLMTSPAGRRKLAAIQKKGDDPEWQFNELQKLLVAIAARHVNLGPEWFTARARDPAGTFYCLPAPRK